MMQSKQLFFAYKYFMIQSLIFNQCKKVEWFLSFNKF